MTSDTSIISVVTVVDSNPTVAAVDECNLTPSAPHVVQEDTSRASSKVGVAIGY